MASIDAAIAAVREVASVGRWAYSMKANWHPAILRRIYSAGLTIECVSQGELEHAFAEVPSLAPDRVLFTPNFAPRSEYEYGFEKGVHVTLDNLYPLKAWPEVFRGREIFVRIDPGVGRGHHHHVRTAGVHSKFGVLPGEADELAALARAHEVRIVGLHAHTGCGIIDVANWTETGTLLAELAERFPDVAVVDLGGGIGVPEQAGQGGIDLAALDAGRLGSSAAISADRVLDGARAVSGGESGSAGRHGDSIEEQGRGALRRHLHRDEFPHPPGVVRSASRYPQPDQARRAAN